MVYTGTLRINYTPRVIGAILSHSGVRHAVKAASGFASTYPHGSVLIDVTERDGRPVVVMTGGLVDEYGAILDLDRIDYILGAE